ncbi:uncharacterized protein LOC132061520 [Lycium ferocissimum]|uniref:uncharacterized protein LOC132061520 n=1 Tax=Lycium ferocissimum TaxID=112874 RepID=UPI002815CC44|nr:uncharacterized protein LOC132061520 [Lycium ferocissimum]
MESCNSLVKVLAIPTSKWSRLRLLIQATGILRATGRSPFEETAAVDLMLDNDMDLQEQITRPFVNHSDQQAGDKARNPRQSWVRILALVRFIVVAKLATRRPSTTSYVQASSYFLSPIDWCINIHMVGNYAACIIFMHACNRY